MNVINKWRMLEQRSERERGARVIVMAEFEVVLSADDSDCTSAEREALAEQIEETNLRRKITEAIELVLNREDLNDLWVDVA